MFMSNSIFLDSSLLIEYIKGAQRELMDILLRDSRINLTISQTITSEYLFYHLAEHGQKSPRTLKESRSISKLLNTIDPLPFVSLFTWLPDNASMLQPAVEFMGRYNLLPNDALILAAIKLHNIPALASFDPDFIAPCKHEGIVLLQNKLDFEEFVRHK